LDIAEKYIDLALEKDPAYAPAYAGRAWLWGSRGQFGLVSPEEAGPQAKSAADIASFYAVAGEKDKALEWLEKAFKGRDQELPYIGCYPCYDDLRPGPRFQGLLRRLKLPTPLLNQGGLVDRVSDRGNVGDRGLEPLTSPVCRKRRKVQRCRKQFVGTIRVKPKDMTRTSRTLAGQP